ncbi:glycosyl transferase [Phlyctochytrium arcticum]|nr:glycosyl transferase [Phlyctochytrium arcticum]
MLVQEQKTVFVTVGTTRFDALLETIAGPEFLTALECLGFTDLVIQHGNSPEPVISGWPLSNSIRTANGPVLAARKISITSYSFKASLHADMKNANLILSHAGAGCILEALAMQKPLLVVINGKLMDNHQADLAHAFQEMRVLVCANVETLVERLKGCHWQDLRLLDESDPSIFATIVEEEAMRQ